MLLRMKLTGEPGVDDVLDKSALYRQIDYLSPDRVLYSSAPGSPISVDPPRAPHRRHLEDGVPGTASNTFKCSRSVRGSQPSEGGILLPFCFTLLDAVWGLCVVQPGHEEGKERADASALLS
jgi:hypothetical protein